jgi:hypothetical protein
MKMEVRCGEVFFGICHGKNFRLVIVEIIVWVFRSSWGESKLY